MNPDFVKARQRQQVVSVLAVLLGLIGMYFLMSLVRTGNWQAIVLGGVVYFGSVTLLLWLGHRLATAWSKREARLQ